MTGNPVWLANIGDTTPLGNCGAIMQATYCRQLLLLAAGAGGGVPGQVMPPT